MFSFLSKSNSNYEKLFYDFSIKSINGENLDFSTFKNKTILMVNVARNCGFTKQYSDLQKLYDKYNLTYTLFPITRSCEGSDYETGNYTFHCGKCWWCEERMWAFGFLDQPAKEFIYD